MTWKGELVTSIVRDFNVYFNVIDYITRNISHSSRQGNNEAIDVSSHLQSLRSTLGTHLPHLSHSSVTSYHSASAAAAGFFPYTTQKFQ